MLNYSVVSKKTEKYFFTQLKVAIIKEFSFNSTLSCFNFKRTFLENKFFHKLNRFGKKSRITYFTGKNTIYNMKSCLLFKFQEIKNKGFFIFLNKSIFLNLLNYYNFLNKSQGLTKLTYIKKRVPFFNKTFFSKGEVFFNFFLFLKEIFLLVFKFYFLNKINVSYFLNKINVSFKIKNINFFFKFNFNKEFIFINYKFLLIKVFYIKKIKLFYFIKRVPFYFKKKKIIFFLKELAIRRTFNRKINGLTFP